MVAMRFTSIVRSDDPPSSSPSSSGALSGGQIAAIVIGTALAVGLVCLLLFYPQLLPARSLKDRSRQRPLKKKPVTAKDPPPQSPAQASGNDGSSNGADDPGRRRRQRPGVAHARNTRPNGHRVGLSRSSGSPVIIHNRIYINSNDYLQPLPALASRRNRDPAPPAIDLPGNAQRASIIPNLQFRPPPNGGIPPQRTRRPDRPAPPPTTDSSQTSDFWNVGAWARSVAPGQIPRAPGRGSTDPPIGGRGHPWTHQAVRSYTRERPFVVPGAFPGDDETAERFQLLTAPARAHAPRAPSHGDNGFWVRDARDSRWRRREREERWERWEREERRERDRVEREERRERDRLEREDRRERREREDRRERM